MTGPLQGIRVLDFTAMIAGPYCTRLLADVGAEVVKLEPPEGDYMRGRPPLRDGCSVYYGILNCGKESVCVDIKNAQGKRLVRDLAAKVDVVVENFRPGVMQRLGFDYAALAAINPALVYCSISGHGQDGPDAQMPAYAPIVQAASGYDLALMSYQEHPDRPLMTGIFTADYLAGVHAFGAICAALVRRGQSGEGDRIDCTLMDSLHGMLAYECAAAQFPVEQRRPLFRATRAQDGFLILAPVSPANFEAMARAAGHPEWMSDARFSSRELRSRNWDALMDELDRWASDKPAAECERTMQEGGVPCSRYYTVRESLARPQAVQRGSLAEVRDGAGTFMAPNTPFKMRDAGARGFVAAPGEHNGKVLREMLGRPPEEIERLVKEGVLCGTR